MFFDHSKEQARSLRITFPLLEPVGGELAAEGNVVELHQGGGGCDGEDEDAH